MSIDLTPIMRFILFAVLLLTIEGICHGFQFVGISNEELSPTAARDHRAAARYHYVKANEAQNRMKRAEEDDDVDGYEKWLNIMRDEDRDMWNAINKYNELRDYLEAKIWTGELEIKNFKKQYEKGTAASILDHLLFRVRT